tara:strand:+ start:808 stop:1110 length:303 start_codon:yes stop_codon:yes gene_type:complete
MPTPRDNFERLTQCKKPMRTWPRRLRGPSSRGASGATRFPRMALRFACRRWAATWRVEICMPARAATWRVEICEPALGDNFERLTQCKKPMREFLLTFYA